MYSLFSDCSSLISLPDISKWDTKNVIGITKIFSNCSFIQELITGYIFMENR